MIWWTNSSSGILESVSFLQHHVVEEVSIDMDNANDQSLTWVLIVALMRHALLRFLHLNDIDLHCK